MIEIHGEIRIDKSDDGLGVKVIYTNKNLLICMDEYTDKSYNRSEGYLLMIVQNGEDVEEILI